MPRRSSGHKTPCHWADSARLSAPIRSAARPAAPSSAVTTASFAMASSTVAATLAEPARPTFTVAAARFASTARVAAVEVAAVAASAPNARRPASAARPAAPSCVPAMACPATAIVTAVVIPVEPARPTSSAARTLLRQRGLRRSSSGTTPSGGLALGAQCTSTQQCTQSGGSTVCADNGFDGDGPLNCCRNEGGACTGVSYSADCCGGLYCVNGVCTNNTSGGLAIGAQCNQSGQCSQASGAAVCASNGIDTDGAFNCCRNKAARAPRTRTAAAACSASTASAAAAVARAAPSGLVASAGRQMSAARTEEPSPVTTTASPAMAHSTVAGTTVVAAQPVHIAAAVSIVSRAFVVLSAESRRRQSRTR